MHQPARHCGPATSGGCAPWAALLSPFDRLVHDRKRTVELFGFDYQLEMYKPAACRRWGYRALPILHGDQLSGKLDALADRKAGVLRGHVIHQDMPFTKPMTAMIGEEIKNLARNPAFTPGWCGGAWPATGPRPSRRSGSSARTASRPTSSTSVTWPGGAGRYSPSPP